MEEASTACSKQPFLETQYFVHIVTQLIALVGHHEDALMRAHILPTRTPIRTDADTNMCTCQAFVPNNGMWNRCLR
jgi:hypothetical protein